MTEPMQPGSYEFRRKTPRTRISWTGQEIGLMLEALSVFKQTRPQHWLKSHDRIIDKLLEGLDRLPLRAPERSTYIRNLPLFANMDFRNLGDVIGIGED